MSEDLEWPKPFICHTHQTESYMGCYFCPTYGGMGGELDLGVQRDSLLNHQNDFAIFHEEFINMATKENDAD